MVMACSRRLAASFVMIAVSALALSTLGGCSRRSEAATHVVAIGDSGSAVGAAARGTLAAGLVNASVAEGLVAFDAEGKVVPALADRWIVTDEGQSYIFRLRGATWGDGGEMTAESVRNALHSAIAALKGTPEGASFDAIDDIRAMTGRVIEIRLNRPMPDFLPLLAQPELVLAHRGRQAGPMALHQDGKVAVLTPVAPEKRGLPAVDGWDQMAHPLRLSVQPADGAIAAFNAGQVDAVLGGTFANLPHSARNMLGKQALRLDPVTGLFGLAVDNEDGLLANAGNREALSMALDRATLATQIGVPGWQATTRLIAPGSDADTGMVPERWADYDLAGRRTLAAQRIAQWVKFSGQQPVLRIALPNGPGADALFGRVQADLGTIGVHVARVGMTSTADLRLIDEVAGEPRPEWFLQRFSCALRPRACSVQADKQLSDALATSDAEAARPLFAQAERDLIDENVFLPLGAPVRWSLIAGDLSGFALNRWGFHPLLPMALRSR
jgi:peptide/nickel transport system substrate-binding protein/oligopeptide transport system substrate-binding protein